MMSLVAVFSIPRTLWGWLKFWSKTELFPTFYETNLFIPCFISLSLTHHNLQRFD